MKAFAQCECEVCRAGMPAMSPEEIRSWLERLDGWLIVERVRRKELEKIYGFSNFSRALDFTVRLGELAEAEGHHPAITTEWGKVTLRWWTHKVNGLHKNDFIMAARSDDLYRSMK